MIDDDVLRPRIPRLGTITTGRGVAATSKAGNEYAKPTRAEALVFHTDDPEVADAVQRLLGGDVLSDSPNWKHDVVTDARTVDVTVLATGFRQALVLYRAAETVRRCDGVKLTTRSGRPVNEPCACAPEMDRGAERACSPETVLPVLVDLDVERLGIWEVRSNSWGSAAAIKGTIKAVAMVGGAGGSFPARLAMVDRQVRDANGRVWDVSEFALTVAATAERLAELAAKAPAALGTGHAPDGPALEASPEDRARLALMETWTELNLRATRAGIREALAEDWRQAFPGRSDFADLSVEDLRTWVDLVRAAVEDAEEGTPDPSSTDASGSRLSDDAGEGDPRTPGDPVTGEGDPAPPPRPPSPDDPCDLAGSCEIRAGHDGVCARWVLLDGEWVLDELVPARGGTD